jgi:hypothetical protein
MATKEFLVLIIFVISDVARVFSQLVILRTCGVGTLQDVVEIVAMLVSKACLTKCLGYQLLCPAACTCYVPTIATMLIVSSRYFPSVKRMRPRWRVYC